MQPSRATASIAAILAFVPMLHAAETEVFRLKPFGPVRLYAPQGAPGAVVLLVSDAAGWNEAAAARAEQLRGLGAVVAGVDFSILTRNLETPGDACAYATGSFEELSRSVERRAKLPDFRPPILFGSGSGGSLVYAILAEAEPEAFLGGISEGFCPHLEVAATLCPGRALVARKREKRAGFALEPAASLGRPWVVLQGEAEACDAEAARRFVAGVAGARVTRVATAGLEAAIPDAYRSLTQKRAEPALQAAEVQDLSLVEKPAVAGRSLDLLAVLLTGDGGWAAIDQGIATGMAGEGLPVVGWSSLSYYWTPRTPAGAEKDLERILRHYLKAWGKSRAILLGFSFGADVLPFIASRLPPELRSRVAGIGLVGFSTAASFEFHVTDWLGGGGDPQYPTLSEMGRLKGLPIACLYGEDEEHSACRSLPKGQGIELPGGHHFGGDYARLAQTLLKALDRPDKSH